MYLETNQWVDNLTEKGSAISARQGHCAAAYNSEIIIFGGSSLDVTYFNDILRLDTVVNGLLFFSVLKKKKTKIFFTKFKLN